MNLNISKWKLPNASPLPKTMNKLERLTAILLLLQDRPRTSEEIARHFEVSKRTILRNIQALSEMGVPIIAREGVGGGYSLPEDYRLAPLPLTAREAFLLLLALSTINQLSDAPFAAERASLAAKLRAALPTPQLASVEQMLTTVTVEVPEREERAPFLEALLEAAQKQQWVQIEYQSAERVSTHHIYPRTLTSQNGLWYCRAFSHERQEERVFRVDRVQALSPAGEHFLPPPPPEPLPYDHPSHPEMRAIFTPRGVAQAEVDAQVAPQIQRQPDGSGQLHLRFPPADLEWWARFFATLGPEATVLAPPALRERLRTFAQNLLEQYSPD
jgi:predicted DNA-binding transcriptional regulator YafY